MVCDACQHEPNPGDFFATESRHEAAGRQEQEGGREGEREGEVEGDRERRREGGENEGRGRRGEGKGREIVPP